MSGTERFSILQHGDGRKEIVVKDENFRRLLRRIDALGDRSPYKRLLPKSCQTRAFKTYEFCNAEDMLTILGTLDKLADNMGKVEGVVAEIEKQIQDSTIDIEVARMERIDKTFEYPHQSYRYAKLGDRVYDLEDTKQRQELYMSIPTPEVGVVYLLPQSTRSLSAADNVNEERRVRVPYHFRWKRWGDDNHNIGLFECWNWETLQWDNSWYVAPVDIPWLTPVDPDDWNQLVRKMSIEREVSWKS